MRFRTTVLAVFGILFTAVVHASSCDTYRFSTPVPVKTPRSAATAGACSRLREAAIAELRSQHDAAVTARIKAFDAQKTAESAVYRCSSDESCASAREVWKKSQDRLANTELRVNAEQHVGPCECSAADRDRANPNTVTLVAKATTKKAREVSKNASESSVDSDGGEDAETDAPAAVATARKTGTTRKTASGSSAEMADGEATGKAATRVRESAAAPQPASRGTRPPAAKGQPRLVALPVEKCIGCTTKLRKRVALMPVKIGTLAAELAMSPETVAAMVRDQLEAELATRPGLAVLSRSELPDVMIEQRLSDSPIANQELAPVKGKVTPAQYLISATVDRIDPHETSIKESNSSAERYEQEALAKERLADDLEAQAANTENERVYSNTGSYLGVVCAAGGLFCIGQKGQAYFDCLQREQKATADCNEKAKEEQERALERKRQENARTAGDTRTQAASARREAQRLRQQAQIEAQQNVSLTETKNVNATMVWRAVDTSTSAVFASGSETGSGQQVQRGVSQSSAFHSTATTDSSKYQVVVNQAIAEVVSKLAKAIEAKIATEPFRAKVVSVNVDGALINGGTNVGMAVGDTFGVRKKRSVLTDPDTGAALDAPGPPVGVIRVSEVNEKTAFAQVITSGGPLGRGDELEWIGMFQLAAPPSSPAAGTTHQ